MTLRLSLVDFLKLLLMTAFAAVCLSETYDAINGLVGGEGWLGPALVNTLLATVVVIAAFAQRRPVRLMPVQERAFSTALWLLIPLGTLLGAALLGVISRMASAAPPPTFPFDVRMVAFVIWIPIVEELVFRAGVAIPWRRVGGPVWGGYFSALLFALVHAHPTIANVVALNVGLPLGPFALGLLCEYIYQRSGGLGVPILTHMACNATVVIFGALDSRWLTDWLYLFYT